MDSVKEAFGKVKADMDNLKTEISYLNSKIHKILEEMAQIKEQIIPTQKPLNPAIPAHNPANQQSFKPLNDQILPISIGNEGVQSNKQSIKQTDKHTPKTLDIIDSAAQILDSLDSVKKEIRLKFKRLTDQEFLVFSTLYQLDEEIGEAEYKDLSQALNLTEISIRNYIGNLIRKGIPVEKHKINNKNIKLSISHNLKKVTSLQTILQLRGI